jgi:preprotein translocase subunit YajC
MPEVLCHVLAPVLAAEGDAAASPLSNMLWPILIVFAIFYFLVIRPGSRERKTREEKIRNLQKHAKVITNAGIHGVVVATDEDSVTLRVDDKNNVRMRFTKAAIWQVLEGAPEGSGDAS